MAHDKFADVSRCLDLCAPHFPEKATLGICHGNGSKTYFVLIPQIACIHRPPTELRYVVFTMKTVLQCFTRSCDRGK